jgi:hypothetical protein
MQNLADIPADNRGSTTLGMYVDLHYANEPGCPGFSKLVMPNDVPVGSSDSWLLIIRGIRSMRVE